MSKPAVNIPKKIVWLASYPKSGNTWFRAFLTALLNNGEVDINGLKTDGIFSSRRIFDNCTDQDSTYMYDEEAKILQPGVFNHLALTCQQERLFIKIHDAYTLNKNNLPIIPTESTMCAIYIIRNPLDIVASLASHFNITLDDAIIFMNNQSQCITKQSNNQNIYDTFKQLLLNWSSNIESWTKPLPFPVLILKYEDMLKQPKTSFSEAIKFMNIEATETQIETALAATNFEQLRRKEKSAGFSEIQVKNNRFFRKGQSGNWTNELTSEQISSIIHHHIDIMTKFGYHQT